MSTLSTADWHRRFQEQASWTQDVRQYLYQRAGLSTARTVLEVGCGTGVIAAELSRMFSGRIFGLDRLNDRLGMARQLAPQVAYIQGEAHCLPFESRSFDITLCHFFLLWLAEPLQVLVEMARITRLGGAVLVLAEPDYGSRIDFPVELERIGKLQAEALRRQSADPLIGRKLASLLAHAGLKEVESGVLGGQWRASTTAEAWQTEWQILENDLQGLLPAQELESLRVIDQVARQFGERILYVPTFYAWGRVR